MAKKQLAIILSEDQVRIGKYTGDAWSFSSACTFRDRKIENLRFRLNDYLQQEEVEPDDFEEFSLSYFSPRFTLIPTAIFPASKPESYMQLAFGNAVTSAETDYNRLPELSLVNVYEMPVWIKNYFVLRFPRIVLQHEVSHLLRGVFAGSTFRLQAGIVFFKHDFLLYAARENKLLFCNSFDYQAAEDVIYQLSFAFERLGLSKVQGRILVCDPLADERNMPERVQELIPKISILKNLKTEVQAAFAFENQLLCV